MLCIKVRIPEWYGGKIGHILRNLFVLAQRNDLQKCKDGVMDKGWLFVETIFSAIKRIFDGEYVYSMVRLKIWYTKWC